ncbi:alpha/beta hydrolase [Chryseosolibacter indicus]|uniref:Alpha/beta hydrolase n=1 Tax=Chryseosolibacter indicus TaxID=2782351 RepID=A0ABS5VVG4_9BACT|nr:alpha/beta hydrolase [Chryseosolibacter indicus]MBT1705415.1 alpha/beta hydrolase [Chryseosolibacter indicus]
MRTTRKHTSTYLTMILIVLMFNRGGAQKKDSDHEINNIILVHGAFLDGSGWEDVYQILKKKGYNVTVTQHALRNFEDDVAAVQRVIDMQDGQSILVGHSYGGVVVSAAGNHPKVSGLVYIAAHAPDANESRAELVKKYPSAYKSLIKGADGFDYIDPAKFADDFAADLPREKATFMAYSQVPTADAVFHAVIQNPAWRSKRSWYLVAKSDRIINRDLERMYAKRANSFTIELDGASHAVYASRPKVLNLNFHLQS